MTKVLSSKLEAGSKEPYDPRPVGAILTEMLRSDSPLAKGYRKFLALKENIAEKGDYYE